MTAEGFTRPYTGRFSRFKPDCGMSSSTGTFSAICYQSFYAYRYVVFSKSVFNNQRQAVFIVPVRVNYSSSPRM